MQTNLLTFQSYHIIKTIYLSYRYKIFILLLFILLLPTKIEVNDEELI